MPQSRLILKNKPIRAEATVTLAEQPLSELCLGHRTYDWEYRYRYHYISEEFVINRSSVSTQNFWPQINFERIGFPATESTYLRVSITFVSGVASSTDSKTMAFVSTDVQPAVS